MKFEATLSNLPIVGSVDNILSGPSYSIKFLSHLSPSGEPIFGDENSKHVIRGCHIGQSDVGHLAIILESDSCLVVLSIVKLEDILRLISRVDTSKPASEITKPLTFKCGRSELRLYPDGRIRILGDDISIESLGKMGLKGATVELN